MNNDQLAKVFEVLDRYFSALDSGTPEYLLPDPNHKWKREITLETMRMLLAELDEYWWSQRSWVPLQEYDAGPDLSRLPDNAIWALAQELDALM